MIPAIRLGAFVGVFAIMALWEKIVPRRRLHESQKTRWTINLSLTLFNTLLIHLLLGAIVVSSAILAQENHWGLFHSLEIPTPLTVLLSILLLDLAIYFQHVAFHVFPLFWRFHMVHHTDLDFDVTTGLRFHPIEILISLFFKVMVVLVIGAPPFAVVIFEIILNATSQFNHGNVLLPTKIDRILRFILVTPDVHRIHHSTSVPETNSNFGFSVTWWDRCLGTFREAPSTPHTDMEIGLTQYRRQKDLGFLSLLKLPFSGFLGNYSLYHE